MPTLTATDSARHSDGPSGLATFVFAAAVALALGACHGSASPPKRSEAIHGHILGRVVDSLVIPPFEHEAGIQINAADLKLFRDQLEEQLTAQSGLKAYPAPPTTLANTVTLAGTLTAFEVHEQTGEGMFLRTIDMILTLAVRVGGEKDPALMLSRGYSYQKLYLTTQGSAALEYDLHNAAREATGTFVAVLVPGKAEAPNLQAAVDTATGKNYSRPLLTRGNREAGFGRFDNAIAAWSLLLYNPVSPKEDERFRVSDRTMVRLASAGATTEDLDALKPLTRRSGESLADFREHVVKALGPDSPIEPKVLKLSDENTDGAQLNLSRAHYNLASVYRYSRRYDVAAYHLSRAYAYDPTPKLLEAWLQLQAQRELVGKDLKSDDPDALTWVRAYQRVPAPFTATVAGGTDERNVVNGVPFPSAGPPAKPAPVPVTPAALPPKRFDPPAVAPAPAARSSGMQNSQTPPAQPPRVYGQPAPRAPARTAPRLGY